MNSATKKVIVLLLVLACAAALAVVWQRSGRPAGDRGPIPVPEAPTAPGISGILVDPEVATRRPLAVVVENHPDSRPQDGLSSADVVYEFLAEGGITRFLALYQSSDPEIVGPVRSARSYIAELGDSWGAVFAHVGGSDQVIAALKAGEYQNLLDLNEYSHEQQFARVSFRGPPHNVYTSGERLRAWAGEASSTPWQARAPWVFSGAPAASDSPASVIAVNFSRPGYDVQFEYDAVANTYRRLLGGRRHVERAEGAAVAPSTVVVQLVDVTPVPDDPLLHVTVGLAGSGKAYVFRGGRVTAARWIGERGAPARYVDADGRDVPLAPGQVWVALVPDGKPGALSWHEPQNENPAP